jgi:hypothetical protein
MHTFTLKCTAHPVPRLNLLCALFVFTTSCPAAAGQDLDLQRLYRCTTQLGGAVAVTDQHRWPVSPVRMLLCWGHLLQCFFSCAITGLVVSACCVVVVEVLLPC